MCGIVGAVAQRNIVPVLIEGLRRLEYRGYDSCGVAVLGDGGPQPRAQHGARGRSRRAGARERISKAAPASRTRAGRRTARRSRTTRTRSSRMNELALVHNGIIENYETLREMLRGKGYDVRLADRHRGDRASDSQPVSRRSVRGGARGRQAIARRVRDRGVA